MCKRITCAKCGKPTWEGCGLHVEEALAGVPTAERCTCPREQPSPKPAGGMAAGAW